MASPKQLRQAARKAGFRGPALLVAVAIALAESGGDEHAFNRNPNGTSDYGAWQINSVHSTLLTGRNPYNLDDNARMAYSLYHGRGGKFTDWVTYNTGAYKAHLTDAQGNGDNQTDPTLGGLVDPNHHVAAGTGVDYTGVNTGLSAIPEGLGIITDKAGNVISGLNPIHDLDSFLTAISSGGLWKRIGIGFLAFMLLLIGFIMLIESNPSVRHATGDAAKVAAL